jgi:hypothetical protein
MKNWTNINKILAMSREKEKKVNPGEEKIGSRYGHEA